MSRDLRLPSYWIESPTHTLLLRSSASDRQFRVVDSLCWHEEGPLLSISAPCGNAIKSWPSCSNTASSTRGKRAGLSTQPRHIVGQDEPAKPIALAQLNLIKLRTGRGSGTRRPQVHFHHHVFKCFVDTGRRQPSIITALRSEPRFRGRVSAYRQQSSRLRPALLRGQRATAAINPHGRRQRENHRDSHPDPHGQDHGCVGSW